MRAALLPTPGEPFMLAYWLRNLETWRDQVDEVVVLINGGDEATTTMVRDVGARVAYLPKPMGHGPALEWLLENTRAEYVVLCEDDAYVRKPDHVGHAFASVMTGHQDIIGSPRYEDNLGDFAEWAPVTGAKEDLSAALWPAFLFARRDDLLDTDRDFGDRKFNIGEIVPGIGPVTPEMCEYVGVSPDYIHVDTFYATTYQLRSKRIELVHRTRTLQAEAVEDWIKYDPPWFHVSGLSAIWIVLGGQTTELPDFGVDGGLWPRRVAWWERTYREGPDWLRESAYGRHYRDRLDSFREKTNLRADLIEEWDARLEPWAKVAVHA
jgi:hypothetical protein